MAALPGAAPLWEQVLVVALTPPIMAALVAILNRGWAGAVAGVLGRKASETTKKEQVWEFWFVLIVLYLGLTGMFVYAHLRG